MRKEISLLKKILSCLSKNKKKAWRMRTTKCVWAKQNCFWIYLKPQTLNPKPYTQVMLACIAIVAPSHQSNALPRHLGNAMHQPCNMLMAGFPWDAVLTALPTNTPRPPDFGLGSPNIVWVGGLCQEASSPTNTFRLVPSVLIETFRLWGPPVLQTLSDWWGSFLQSVAPGWA